MATDLQHEQASRLTIESSRVSGCVHGCHLYVDRERERERESKMIEKHRRREINM
jgi:hypothetical protein